ncbi:DNA polymerase III, delta prime subunit [Nitrosospira multiformis]|uniref:DNA polymerase III subunit delta' n=1 Tax=Nitrosospira multiformis TaxID=1231 RepID=A0A1I0D3N1_9PROT|nr:DNA polymerase III subunit delta' [Nitrosospira multiformis]SET26565.1 DNA polymerase III, delta prime subunit [Nitrosospira multiformis]
MSNIYGWQEEVWRKLTGTLGHALLLRGRKGLGKLAFARYLAKSRLCENPSVEGKACEVCASCHWFEQGSHPDFCLVEPEAVTATSVSGEGASEEGVETGDEAETQSLSKAVNQATSKSTKKPSRQISISQIRELGDFVNITSHQNGYKIILIHPAETMNPAAANALLKNLEEPPLQTLFILVTHQAQYLLPTIRSRCRQIAMPVPDAASAALWLKQQGVKAPERCLASAGYSPLTALEFANEDYLVRHSAFIQQISTPSSFDVLGLAEEMQKSDLVMVVSWLQKWCYDLMSFRMAQKVRYHLDMRAQIKSLASGLDPYSMAAYLRALDKTQQLARHPLNPRLFLEELLFSYVTVLSGEFRNRGKAG